MTATAFKTIWTADKYSLKNESIKTGTTLSQHIWRLISESKRFSISWKFLALAQPFSGLCQFCYKEKCFIIIKSDMASLNLHPVVDTNILDVLPNMYQFACGKVVSVKFAHLLKCSHFEVQFRGIIIREQKNKNTLFQICPSFSLWGLNLFRYLFLKLSNLRRKMRGISSISADKPPCVEICSSFKTLDTLRCSLGAL